jgi:hypothetical protein
VSGLRAADARSKPHQIDNSSFEKVEEFKIFGNNHNKSKFCSGRSSEQIEVRQCLLSFGAESFVFQFAVQKIQGLRYKELILPVSFVWV